VDVMFEQYLERQNRLDRDPKTIELVGRVLRAFDSHLDALDVRAAEVESWVVEEYVLGTMRKAAYNTKRSHLSYIGAAYRYARRRRQVAHDPTEGVQLPRPPDREPRILSTGELRAIYAAIESRREEMSFHLLAYAGLRRTEAAKLREEHVDLSSQTLTVHGKGSKIRKVPIHPALWDVLERQMEGTPIRPLVRGRGIDHINPTWFGLKVAALAERANIDASPHDFRRTAASSLYANGVPEHTIDRIFGWAPRTVGRKFYLNVADDQLQTAILRIYRDAPVSNPPKRGGRAVAKS